MAADVAECLRGRDDPHELNLVDQAVLQSEQREEELVSSAASHDRSSLIGS
jgi:hypothetical protein